MHYKAVKGWQSNENFISAGCSSTFVHVLATLSVTNWKTIKCMMYIYHLSVWCTFTITECDVHSPSRCMMFIYHHRVWCTFTITVYDVHLPSQSVMYIYHHSVWCTFTITVYDVHLQSQCPTLVMHTDDDRNQQQSNDTNSLHSNTDQIQIICASWRSAQYHMVVRSKACEEGLGAWHGTRYNKTQ